MLVNEDAFEEILELIGGGRIDDALVVFGRSCRRTAVCDKKAPAHCGQCLAGTLLYASLEGRRHIYTLTYDRLKVWCAERSARPSRMNGTRLH